MTKQAVGAFILTLAGCIGAVDLALACDGEDHKDKKESSISCDGEHKDDKKKTESVRLCDGEDHKDTKKDKS